jgi:hypothetical protein
VVGHRLGPQVEVGEFPEHQVEQVGLVKTGDLLVEAVLSSTSAAPGEKAAM